jgi:hypothetical protein
MLLQLVVVAVVPLNLTVLEPCGPPKFVPEMVTDIPIDPTVGDRLVIVGVGRTVKLFPLLASPVTVTTTFPVVAPAGTGTKILLRPQLVGEAGLPLNVTVLVPCAEPKFVPAIVTDVATGPDVGDKLAMFGPPPTLVALIAPSVLS